MRIVIGLDTRHARSLLKLGGALFVAAAVVVPALLYGGTVSSLVVFSPGTRIRAADINANFGAIQTAVNDNDARIGDLSALQTTAKSSLVAAVNEVKATVLQPGPQGPQGPAGPPGSAAGLALILGPTHSGWGATGASNGWTAANVLAGAGPGLVVSGSPGNPATGPAVFASRVVGKQYSASLRIETATFNLSGIPTGPGNALVAGDLVIDLKWFFGDHWSPGAASVTQTSVVTIPITQTTSPIDATVKFTGTVPAAPLVRGTAALTLIDDGNGGVVQAFANAATTAQGASVNALEVTIGP